MKNYLALSLIPLLLNSCSETNTPLPQQSIPAPALEEPLPVAMPEAVRPPLLSELNNTVWIGYLDNNTLGERASMKLAIDKVSSTGAFSGIFIIESPLLGSGDAEGKYDPKDGSFRMSVAPRTEKGAPASYIGKMKGTALAAAFITGSYQHLPEQEGTCVAKLLHTGQRQVDQVNDYYPRRVKEELQAWWSGYGQGY